MHSKETVKHILVRFGILKAFRLDFNLFGTSWLLPYYWNSTSHYVRMGVPWREDVRWYGGYPCLLVLRIWKEQNLITLKVVKSLKNMRTNYKLIKFMFSWYLYYMGINMGSHLGLTDYLGRGQHQVTTHKKCECECFNLRVKL